jgi:hypothetical protein
MSDVAEDSVKKGKETIGTTLLSVSGTLIDLTYTYLPFFNFTLSNDG